MLVEYGLLKKDNKQLQKIEDILTIKFSVFNARLTETGDNLELLNKYNKVIMSIPTNKFFDYSYTPKKNRFSRNSSRVFQIRKKNKEVIDIKDAETYEIYDGTVNFINCKNEMMATYMLSDIDSIVGSIENFVSHAL